VNYGLGVALRASSKIMRIPAENNMSTLWLGSVGASSIGSRLPSVAVVVGRAFCSHTPSCFKLVSLNNALLRCRLRL